MLYQSYVEKLEKWRRVFDRVWRLRFVFLTAFLLILAGIGALLGIQGIVHDVHVPESIVYGETFSPTAEAIFGDAEFEYRRAGESEWTRETPYLAGEYECRAFGRSVVGTDRPAEAVPFTIEPALAHIRTTATSLVFGEDLPFTTSDLKYGDTLVVDGFLAEEIEGQKLNVQADPAKIRVLNEAGEDVSFCYTFDPQERSIDDLRRPVSLSTASETFVYDGTAHESRGLTAEGLVDGHTVEAVFASITDVGTCRNELTSVQIFDADGNDMTAHYRINIVSTGTLTVTKRPITVSTASDRFTYDGRAHDYTKAEVSEGTLAGGQELLLSDCLSVLDAGEYSNAPTVRIMAGEADVTANYEIAEDFGTVTVGKKALKLTTDSPELTYDGQLHNFDTIQVDAADGLAAEQSLKVTPKQVREAGAYDYLPAYEIVAGETAISKENYEINFEGFGTITVRKKALKLTTDSPELTYDGQLHSFDTIQVDAADGLAAGQSLKVTPMQVREAGAYDYLPAYEIVAGEETVSKENYEINFEGFGTIRVAPLAVTLKTASDDDIVYNGKPQAPAGQPFPTGGTALAAGHSVTAEYVGRTDADTYDNEIVEGSLKVFDGEGKEVSPDNYAFTWELGSVTVRPLAVTVRTADHAFPYDGMPHAERGYTLPAAKFVAGQTAEYDAPTIKNVSETVINEFTNFTIREGTADVTKNYALTWVFGTLTVTQRSITVTTASDALTYDGKPHVYGANTLTNGANELVAGHSYVITSEEGKYTFTAANTYTNSPEFEIHDENGEDVTENYAIATHYGTVTIGRRVIDFVTEGGEWIYDGLAHENAAARPADPAGDRGVADGQDCKITVYETVTVTTVCENISNALQFGWSVTADGEDVTQNYEEGTTYFGLFTVKKRPIVIQTMEREWMYDGTAHFDTAVSSFTPEREGEGLLESLGHTIVAAEYGYSTFLYVSDTGENRVEYRIYGGMSDLTQNYEIRYDYSTATITARPITVTTKDGNWTYDGDDHAEELSLGPTIGGEGLAAGDEIARFGQLRSFRNVSDSGENVVSYRVYRSYEDVTANYDFGEGVQYGAVTIDHRPIGLATKSESFIYDGTAHVYDEGTFIITGGGLVYGQFFRITSGEETYIFENAKEDPYENRPAFEIVDGSGEDVTANYDFGEGVLYGAVTIDFREITITTQSYHEIYDGLTHDLSSSPVDVKGLLSFHELRVETRPVYYGVIDQDNGTTYQIFYGEKEVTANYHITYVKGKVRIDPRPIKITTAGDSWIYDGVDHAEALSSVPSIAGEGFGEGDRFEPIKETITPFCDVRDSGENRVRYLIRNAKDEDVTSNYEVDDSEFGMVTIAKRPISLTTKGDSWVYDGEEHFVHTVTFDAPAEDQGILIGHEVEYTVIRDTKIRNVSEGPRRNDLTVEITSITADGEDVTDNYDIEHLTYSYESLEIRPRPLHVITNTRDWIYDGETHSDDGFTFGEYQEGKLDGSGLVRGQVYDVRYTSELPTITNVLELPYNRKNYVTNEFWLEFTFYTDEGRGEVVEGSNYTIDYTFGMLTVSPRPIDITTKTMEWIYDGTEHDYYSQPEDFERDEGIVERGLLLQHEIRQWIQPPQGVHVNVKDPQRNEARFRIGVIGSDETVSSNYDINYIYGTITILPRPIRIQTGTASYVYNGLPQSCFEYQLLPAIAGDPKEFGLLEGLGHYVQVPTITYATYVCEPQPNIFTFEIRRDGVDISSNYVDLSEGSEYVVYGTLEITQRPIAIVAMTETVTYRGEAFEYGTPDRLTSYEIDDGKTPRGLLQSPYHEIRISNAEKLRFTDASDKPYENIPEIAIYEYGQDVTRNYAVTVTNGEITIQRRHIDPKTASDEFVYDGIGRFYGQETITCGVNEEGKSQLAEGHQFSITSDESTYFFKEANEAGYVNQPTFVILDAWGEDVSKNYDIAPTDCGRVVIHKRPITIVSDSMTWVHDGEEHEHASAHALDTWDADSGLLYGLSHEIRVTVAASSRLTEITDTMSVEGGYYDRMGFVTNEINTYHIFEADRDVTENYFVTVQNDGQLRIKSPIVIFLYSFSKDFDGMSLAESLIESELDENLFYDVEQRPPEIDESAIRIDWSKLEDVYAVGMTLIDVENRISVTWGGRENDPDRIDRVDFVADVGDDEALFEITPRRLIVTSDSYRAARKDRVTFTYEELTISEIQFFTEGGGEFTYSCDFTGILTSGVSSASNTFENFRVYDAEGKDITGLAFAVEYRYGILSWIDDGTETVSAQSLPALPAFPARKEM